MVTRKAIEPLVSAAAQLSLPELDELIMALEGLRTALAAEDDTPERRESPEKEAGTRSKSKGPGSRGGRGHIERKLINGCGPYLYLRYYKGCENGRSLYGSLYLGKEQSQDE